MQLRFAFCKALQAAKAGLLEQTAAKEYKIDRLSMTPHQYWVAVGKGMEKPYTGEYWFNKEVGQYHCAHCDSKLFSFEHKFKSPNGYASFFNHVKNSVRIEESDKKEERDVKCGGCYSFIGKVSFDGPPPTFIRYSVNSSALKFKLKPFFEDPYLAKQKKSEEPKRDFIEEKKAQAAKQ